MYARDLLKLNVVTKQLPKAPKDVSGGNQNNWEKIDSCPYFNLNNVACFLSESNIIVAQYKI